MIRRLVALALLSLLAWMPRLPGARAAGSAVPVAPVSARALLARLHDSGRAEAAVGLRRTDALSGRTIVRSGRLALELPRLARLDLDDGERLALRADGGDWLQPATRQLIRAGPRGAAGALQWWGALLDPAGAGLEETQTGERRYSLRVRGRSGPAQRIELDTRGLPRRLVIALGEGEQLEYRLTGWRFTRARGAKDFALGVPPGFDVVNLP